MSVDTPQAPPEEPDAAVHSLPHEVQLRWCSASRCRWGIPSVRLRRMAAWRLLKTSSP